MEHPTFMVKNRKRLIRRYRADQLFRGAGIAAISFALLFILILFVQIFSKGYTAFFQTQIELQVTLSQDDFYNENLRVANYQAMIKRALLTTFPGVKKRAEKKQLYALVSSGAAFRLQELVLADPSQIGSTITLWVPANDDVDMWKKGKVDLSLPESQRRISDKQLGWLGQLEESGQLRKVFNRDFFRAGDSREPELAGIWGAVCGSFYTLLLTFIISFPLGIATAIYLEEFAPKNRLVDIIEVNINNLAAVPSVIFGLLGLAVFINFWGMPRSTPLVGGVVLSLMTLPTIIIASRASLQAVPPSIREAALGVGASRVQVVFHHLLPLALPGMLTGTIIGMAQALGETAPLLMVGMVAFIVDIPAGLTDPAAVLPVQIFLWADSPERAFTEKTSAAIMVLLFFLLCMNALALYLRKKFETKWS